VLHQYILCTCRIPIVIRNINKHFWHYCHGYIILVVTLCLKGILRSFSDSIGFHVKLNKNFFGAHKPRRYSS
jgi:hypothetical protein